MNTDSEPQASSGIDDGAPAVRRIPPGIELAWGLRDRGVRGPKPGLTLERIVEAGIAIASDEGLDALSMSRPRA